MASNSEDLPRALPQAPTPRPAFNFEKLLGANWLARAGVLVLALGVVFFLKLAYDNNWVPLWGRAAIGVVGGLALFATGELLRLRKFDSTFSQIVAGGGAIIAYVTLYVAYALPDYRSALGLTLAVEVALLAVCAALLGAYALWRNLPVLAGVAVGLCAILVAPAGEFSMVGLLFVTFLGSALLAAAAWRGWSAIVLTSIISLNLAHLAATNVPSVPWWLVAASAALVNSLAVAAASRSRDPDLTLARVEAALAVALLAAILAVTFGQTALPHPTAWSLLGVGLASLAAAVALPRIAPALGLMGGGMLLLWPLLHFPGQLTQSLAYAGLGIAAWAAAFVLPHARWVRTGAAAAAGLGTATLLILALADDAAQQQPWQAGGLALLQLALAATLWVTEMRSRPTSETGMAALVVSTLLLVAWPFLQFHATLLQPFTLLAAAAAVCVAAASWGPGREPLRVVASLVVVAALGSLLYLGAGGLAEQQAWQSGALALGVLGLALALWGARPLADKEGAPAFAGFAGLAIGAVLVASWPVIQFPDTLWQTLTYAVCGLALWGISLRWGAGARILRTAATLVGVVGLGSLYIVNWLWTPDGLGSAGVAALLLALGCLCWATARLQPTDRWVRGVAVALAALAPVVAFGFLLTGWGIAVSWAVEALVFVGLGLALRDIEVRIASFGLFGLVLARLFLWDFRSLAAGPKVIVFLCTGALLLAGAFLYARQRKTAPVAPR